MNIYEARFKNAMKMYNKVKSLLEKGYIVYDHNHERVEEVSIKGNDINIGNTTVFTNDKEYDEGIYQSIKEWNKYFDNWLVFKGAKKLKEVRR